MLPDCLSNIIAPDSIAGEIQRPLFRMPEDGAAGFTAYVDGFIYILRSAGNTVMASGFEELYAVEFHTAEFQNADILKAVTEQRCRIHFILNENRQSFRQNADCGFIEMVEMQMGCDDSIDFHDFFHRHRQFVDRATQLRVRRTRNRRIGILSRKPRVDQETDSAIGDYCCCTSDLLEFHIASWLFCCFMKY